MKKLYPYLLVALTVLMPMTLWAQVDPFDTTHKLFRDKHVTSNPDGTYTLDLETYATGYTKQTMAYVATDFVLVLDRSGSMTANNVSPGVTRLDALKTAVKEFIDLVYANNPKTGNKHRISIVWYGGVMSKDKKTATSKIAPNLYNNSYDLIELTDANITDYKQGVTNVTASGATTPKPDVGAGTLCDAGLAKAYEILNSATSGRNKVTIFFTDGEPGGYAGYFHEKVAQDACKAAVDLKSMSNTAMGGSGNSKTFQSVVYAVGIMNDGTADAHVKYGATTYSTSSGKVTNDKYRFMHYVSSNYSLDKSKFPTTYGFGSDISDADCKDPDCPITTTHNGSEDPHGYFIKSDGLDLSSAFAKIATNELKDRNEDLTATKTVVKDVMSDNFRLPKGTDASKIKLYTCDADKNNKTILTETPVYKADKVVWRTTGDAGDPSGCKTVYKDADNKTIWKTGDAGSAPVSYDHKEYWKPLTLPSGSVTVDVSTKTVSVTNYDYVKNFVGPIHDFTGATNDIAGWTGQKLIMEFVIEKEPSCPGGGTLDTNDPGSGVYVTPSTLPLSSYPVPDVGIPNIEVVVQGLSTDGSAVFEIVKVTDSTGDTPDTTNPYKATVVLSSATNTIELVSVGYGYYKVTQKTWDWKHTVKYDGDSDGTPETDGTSYVLHMEDPGSGTKPDKITFTFGNALKSGTLPDSDEKSVNNIFKP